MDVAQLGLRIENGQFVQGAKEAEAAVKNLGGASDALTAKLRQEDAQLRKMVETTGLRSAAQNASIQAHLREIGMLERYLQIQRQVDEEMRVADQVTAKLNATTAANVTHTNNATLGANRFRSSLSTLASQALGTSSSLGQLGGLLTTFAVGSGVGVAIIAGIAAIAFAYDQLTASTRKAREETQNFLKSLRDQAQAAKDATVSGSQERVKQAKQIEQDAIAAAREFNRTGGGPSWQAQKVEQRITDATKDRILAEANAAKILAAANREVAEAGNKANIAMAESNSSAIEQLKRIDGARQQSADKLKRLQEEAMALEEKRSRHDAEIRKQDEDREKRTVQGVRAILDELEKVAKAKRDALLKAYGIDEGALHDDIGRNVNDALKRDADAKKYQEDMRGIWRQGIGKIVTDGTKSYRDFFEDVLQMFTKMMTRMAEEAKRPGGKPLGIEYKLLGLGSAAITGGFAGYQLGQQQGSAGGGAILGGIGGAYLGAQLAGPVGAVVGGLVGFTAGLIGGASAARAHAEALKQAAKQVAATIADLHDMAMGTSGSLESNIRHAREQFDQARTAATAAAPGSGSWWQGPEGIAALQARLAGITADEAAYIELLTKEQAVKAKNYAEDLKVRLLRAQGHGAEADAMAFRNQQQRERDDLIKSFGDVIDAQEAATLALLDQVLASERLRKSIDELNTNVRNAPSGFKIESYINRYADPRPWGIGGPMSIPYSPGRPSGTAGGGGHSIDLRGATFQIKGGTGKELLADFMIELRKVQSVTVGGNAPLAEALDWA